MSKFNKKKSGDLPAISTASLPDIVFMLLFFFMTVTVMKDSSLMVQNELPYADQIQKLDKKDRVIYIYAGKPSERYQSTYGTSAKIQLNDKFADVSDVANYILAERAKKREELQNVLTTALKVDEETNMGLVSDIKQELRKVNALKINYTTKKGDAFRNMQK
ncbi:ExbD/TolR family protein [Robertkochia solimangrovi]|uniref:ExbD/TolR family protein n=1 Tax=Robertkochia solimangrovi TaxID=2213046 RepID=UPI00117C8D16|nr:biopolymer transporter ExbD [Robertkochia solimangrovi]TRZ46366.1 biopolymer transporter ExbD [Robertkochia solimangrovi]